ncbi:MAG TPA: NirA family protein [Tepidisphaeraceae bacterium]|nr:NirA family protein [Tepidisphaeraceae bacterium]
MDTIEDFTPEQKQYLHGFAAGSGLAHSLRRMPTFTEALGIKPEQLPGGPEAVHFQAQDRAIAEGKKLCSEEQAKRRKFPLDMWDDVRQHAADARAPRGTDVLAFKYHGLFWVAPAQDAFMCRLRFAGGMMTSQQLSGVARLADDFAGGYADVTTRANLQLREIKPENTTRVIEGLHDLGIINRGAGADNIRNITASPTAGIDPHELIDTRPLARELHHYILNHRELYGLPRKFNIAFDGGGSISALEDTNDIGFAAVRVGQGQSIPAGVYFRLALGGITGHKDFARDTGVLLKPDECIPAAAAILRVFIDNGDRTDRTKARLKYLLDQWGLARFITEAEAKLPFKFRRLPIERCDPRPAVAKHGHIGFHPQKQPGLHYAGVVLPVARMRVEQMLGLAKIADRYGSGTIRLTVWQNLLISDIPSEQIDQVKHDLEALGLHWSASTVRGGLVACTGSAGCKFAAADTKKHGLALADYLESRIELDQPINIHLTGCPHSCAQHYIGDIGLLGTKVPVGEEIVEGYHVFVGGAYGAQQEIARQIFTGVAATQLPALIERMLRAYLNGRASPTESFRDFTRRLEPQTLRDLIEPQEVPA